jgi:RNA polymerase sigma factor (sigma-70 family)
MIDEIIVEYKLKPTDKKFREIYKKYKKLICWMVLRRKIRECDVDEVIHELYCELPYIVSHFEINMGVQFSSYLIKCCNNHINSRYYNSLSDIEIQFTDLPRVIDDSRTHPEDLIYWSKGEFKPIIAESESDEENNIQNIINNEIENLTPSEKEICQLFYMQDKTLDEISDITKYKISMIKNKIMSIKRKLYPKFIKYEILRKKFDIWMRRDNNIV